MRRTIDADYGVTYSGCITDIHSASTYRHANSSGGRYGASSDRNNSSCGNQADSNRNNSSCGNQADSNRNNSSCGNQAGSHRNAGTSAHRASCSAYRCHDGGRSGGCGIHHSQ